MHAAAARVPTAKNAKAFPATHCAVTDGDPGTTVAAQQANHIASRKRPATPIAHRVCIAISPGVKKGRKKRDITDS